MLASSIPCPHPIRICCRAANIQAFRLICSERNHEAEHQEKRKSNGNSPSYFLYFVAIHLTGHKIRSEQIKHSKIIAPPVLIEGEETIWVHPRPPETASCYQWFKRMYYNAATKQDDFQQSHTPEQLYGSQDFDYLINKARYLQNLRDYGRDKPVPPVATPRSGVFNYLGQMTENGEKGSQNDTKTRRGLRSVNGLKPLRVFVLWRTVFVGRRPDYGTPSLFHLTSQPPRLTSRPPQSACGSSRGHGSPPRRKRCACQAGRSPPPPA